MGHSVKVHKTLISILIIAELAGLPRGLAADGAGEQGWQKVAARLEADKVVVTVAGRLFTCYKFGKAQKYPYFWPVDGPVSGKSVTTESSEPYPHHHSLFFGCDRVNGGNYWQDGNDRGQVVSQGPKIIEAEGQRIVFRDECLWVQPGKQPVIRDLRCVTVTAPDRLTRFIDLQITLVPLAEVQILKTNHSLFAARVVPELSVGSGGTLVNAEGKTGEKGTWGVESAWCDFFGTRENLTEGIAILQHPSNRWYPSKWFTRDYGFFSPTPMNWLENDQLVFAMGQKFTLRYRVVVHAGDAKAARMAEIFEQYRRAKPCGAGTSADD